MNHCETLRGRGSFDALFAGGLRANASLLRCLYLFDPKGEAGSARVGFAVPRKTGTAVRRNRLRRLMREAFRREQAGFLAALHGAGRSVSMLFVYRGGSQTACGPLRLHAVHRDVVQLCHAVLASATRIAQ